MARQKVWTTPAITSVAGIPSLQYTPMLQEIGNFLLHFQFIQHHQQP
jgi:hypothetical protein